MRYKFWFIVTAVFVFSCNNDISGKLGSCYYRNAGKIMYLFGNPAGVIDSLELPGANADYFEVIYDELPGVDCFNGNIWAKDKSNVWFKNFLLKGADPQTFKVLENGYSKDKSYAYYYNEQLKGAKPEEFETPGWFYAKTQSTVWYCGKPITGIDDVPSFNVIDGYFSKDKNTVYFIQDTCFEKLSGSDPSTFKCITDDKSYRLTGLKWYKDKNKVYCIDTEFNPDNDEFLTIIDASVSSFQILPRKYYSKDATVIYYKNKAIENADMNTFYTLGNDYSRDSLSIFYKCNKLNGVDVRSFRAVKDSFGYDAADSNNRYNKGKKIK